VIGTRVARKSDAARAMDGLRKLVRGLRIGNSEIQRATGVSSAQLFALRQLSRRSGQSLSDLAALTLTTQSSISEVVSRLVDNRLVSRNVAPADHRRTELRLTDRGRAVLASAAETPQEKMLAGLLSLGARKQRLIAEGIEEWLEASHLSGIEPTMFFEPPDSA